MTFVMNSDTNTTVEGYVFHSDLCDSKEWKKRNWSSKIMFYLGAAGLLLNVTSRSIGTDSKSILDHLGVPSGIGSIILIFGLLLLVASMFVGFYDYRKGKLEIKATGFTIKRDCFDLSSISNLEVVFNDNKGKVVYGKRNYATGGKNFIRFKDNKGTHDYEFYIPTNTEEQKLRKLIQTWSQSNS